MSNLRMHFSEGWSRPAIGTFPYPHRTLDKVLGIVSEPLPPVIIDRTPCPRCGVRGDVGCRHTRSQAA